MDLDKYKIIKTIDTDENDSVYLVEEIESKNIFVLKKLFTTTKSVNYQTVIKEFSQMGKEHARIDNKPSSPFVVDFLSQGEYNYFILEYRNETSLRTIISYSSIGKILNNRYVVVKGIACGGFGVVYLVRDLSLPGKYWALKEMQDQGGNLEIIEKSFRVEAEMLSSLEHPTIPRISDFFNYHNKCYLIMDYVNGETLKKKINDLKKDEYIPERDILKWAVSICDVLNYLHTRETPIIFRDLKPDNIMITTEGDVKLIDFGIARVFQGLSGDTTKVALLTEGYAPQEQWFGKAEPRSDIYSLGATLYHLLSGMHPKKVAPDFPPIENYNPSVSTDLSRIVFKAMEAKVEDRYSNVLEMKNELLKLLNQKEEAEKASYHFSMARKYENEEDYFNANFEYMKALDFSPQNHEIIFELAKCSEKLGFKDKSIIYYEKLMTMNIPDSIKNIVVKNLELLGKKTSSLPSVSVKKEIYKPREVNIQEHVKKITNIMPPLKQKNNFWSRFVILSVLAAIIFIILGFVVLSGFILALTNPEVVNYFYANTPGPTVSTISFKEYYNKAQELQKENKYTEALSYYDKAIECDPNSFNAWNEKGICLYSQKKYSEAIECYKKAHNLEPGDHVIIYNIGLVYFDKKEYEKAIEYFDESLKLDDSYMDSWNYKGLCLYSQKKYSEAIECYKKASNLKPDDHVIIYNIGQAYFYEKEYENAIEYFNKSLKIDSSYVDSWNYKGLCLYYLSRYNEASYAYQKAIDLNSNEPVYWVNKGQALYYEKKYDRAMKCLNKAIELDSSNASSWYYKGKILYDRGKYKLALECMSKAGSLSPDDEYIWNDTGNCYFGLENYSEAIKCYNKSLDINSEDYVVWTNKGDALYNERNYNGSLECYNKSLMLNPDYERASDGKKRAQNKL